MAGAFDMRAALARHDAYRATLPVKAPTHQSEGARIAGLPRWSADDVPDLTSRYRTPTGTMSLRPVQNQMLWNLERSGGLCGPVGVGGGKGLFTMLAPVALDAKRPLLLLPANLQDTFHMEYRKFRAHFKVATHLKIMTYSALSVNSGADFLMKYQPDLIICDEAHFLRHLTSTRTKRFMRYARQFPLTKYAFISGTMTKRGLKDYAHLMELALGNGAPIPLQLNDLLSWANVLDADGVATDSDWGPFNRCLLPRNPTRNVRVAREAFAERFRATPGVVASDESNLGVGLYFHEMPVVEPEVVKTARLELQRTWCRPDGEELVDAFAVFRVEQQLSSGFYYVWDWPNGVVDTEWMEKRAAWNKSVRRILKCNDHRWDSPLRVALALSQGTLTDADALAAYEAWKGVRHRPQPPTKAVWIDDFMVRRAGQWVLDQLAANPKVPVTVWYEHVALGEALGLLGLPVYGVGRDPQTSQDEALACSITVNGTGKNLQRSPTMLVLNWPRSGSTVEQLVGRSHRPGQLADDVNVYYVAHTPQARISLHDSLNDETYVEQSMSTRRKVELGTWLPNTWSGNTP